MASIFNLSRWSNVIAAASSPVAGKNMQSVKSASDKNLVENEYRMIISKLSRVPKQLHVVITIASVHGMKPSRCLRAACTVSQGDR